MKFNLLFLLCVLPILAAAQIKTDLPHYMTEEEKAQMPFYTPPVAPGDKTLYTDPPDFTPRTMAEFEEIQALCVTYTSYKSIVAQIIEHARQEVEVIVICNDSTEVKYDLTNLFGFDDLDNISYIETPYNSVWIRDYGPNTIYANDVEELHIADWIYNRPRPYDDLVPEAIADFVGVDIYATTEAPNDLVHTGGNFTSDGLGTAFSSNLIIDENPDKSEAEIDDIMNQYMGISRYIKMETLPYDAIHHIDMHMRLLDEETIMVGQYPEGVADGPQIEANLQYVLTNFESSFGTPYRIVRIQMPPEANGSYPPWGDYRTYTNSVLVNKTIIVPTYQELYDTTNLRIYRENMPGYNVVGINCNQMIGALGALHCITRAVGVDDPLWIVHQELRDAVDVEDDFEVNATIKHRDGVSEATLYYTTDTLSGYESTSMSLTNADEDTWTAYIPNPGVETDIFYYIQAEANNGKVQVRPLPAPAGYFDFNLAFTTSTEEPVFEASRMDAIFPNPASSITCIPVFSGTDQKARITVYDALGRLIEVIFEGNLQAGESKHFIMANEYAAGAYMVQLQTEEGTFSQRLIIK
ncbi:MAG: T9SS type A sorting domain-containing protein [Bacteroidetes bacterium]|nr:T9SS type A sorting domain-containing protein [Bacteroidota bacterium]